MCQRVRDLTFPGPTTAGTFTFIDRSRSFLYDSWRGTGISKARLGAGWLHGQASPVIALERPRTRLWACFLGGVSVTILKFDLHGPLLQELGNRAYMCEDLRSRLGT